MYIGKRVPSRKKQGWTVCIIFVYTNEYPSVWFYWSRAIHLGNDLAPIRQIGTIYTNDDDYTLKVLDGWAHGPWNMWLCILNV